MTAKEKAARKRLTAAMKAYSRAVKQLEKAIGATEDAIALDYVLENREFAEEEEATAHEETRARQTGVSVEQLRKEAKEAE